MVGHWIARSKNVATSRPERPRAVRRAITTMSDGYGNSARACRNHSLIQRFTRLRTTALPTRLLTVTPSRDLRGLRDRSSSRISVPALGCSATMTTKPPETQRLPDLTARLKSRVRNIRSARQKRPVFGNTGLLRGNAGCETLTAFRATSLENCSSRTRLHSRAKAMISLPADTTGLVSAFHQRPSISTFSHSF